MQFLFYYSMKNAVFHWTFNWFVIILGGGIMVKIVAIILFIVTYALLLAFPKHRAYIALTSALVFVISGIMPFDRVFKTIDWNVLMMIAGTMGIVSLFIESKMPALLADLIIKKTSNLRWAIVALSLFAGFISAFIDNVATVLILAPIAINISKKLKISPIASIIAIAVASNLQGAATLVGDTTSILLGGYANLNFLQFFFVDGRIGIFWVVQAGAIAATGVLVYIMRKEKQQIKLFDNTRVDDFFPSFLLIGMVVLLIIASFLPNMPKTINGIICISIFSIGLLRVLCRQKTIKAIRKPIKEIDYFTVLLLASLFIVIGGISEVGLVKDISFLFVKVSKDNVFVIYTLIVWVSVLLSAFIDNIPYVTTMLPVTASIAGILGIEPNLLFFGLLIGATLGGNLTPIGASANVTAIGILRKEGYEVKATDFMKIGLPFTLAAVTVGYVLIWIIWS